MIHSFYKEDYSSSISKLQLKRSLDLNTKALFLDRDGILIKDVHRINSPEQVELCNNVITFLKAAKRLNYDIVVVSNQSSVSRDIISYKEYLLITSKFLSYLPKSLYPNLILASFHLPGNKNNLSNYQWRKPGKGMFDYAINLNSYDTSTSIMIGDKLTDLIPASKCNINDLIYIPSSIHIGELEKVQEWNNLNSEKIKVSEYLNPKYLK
tara:strand:+ start:4341 stop:4970 length:630 start_codon:yes stop_codon:yes gene_type:complete